MEQTSSTPTRTWAQTLRVYLEPASLRMLFLGFSAGLPLLLVVGTLSFRVREAGINRATISFLGWVGLAYGFKWIWSPLVDRLPIPLLTRLLGQRRSWLLASQLLVMVGLAGSFAAGNRWLVYLATGGTGGNSYSADAYRQKPTPAACCW